MSNDLGEELVDEILSRLPSKSLLRFRSVSKSVCDRIRSPGFIRLHTLRSPNKVMITYELRLDKQMYTSHSKGQFPNIGVPLEFPFTSFMFVGSCNGILCVYDYGVAIQLWNPSIKRKVMIHDKCRGGVFGFGFDPVLEDYKVLRISKAGAYVYTMKTHTWREIASPTTPFGDVISCQCLFNGALHWNIKNFSPGYILTFDLTSEVFSAIELPETIWRIDQVTIIKGCLAVISLCCSRVWVRREYNSTDASWSVAYDLVINQFRFGTPLGVLQITPNDEFLYLVYSKQILAYNVGTKELSRVMDMSDYSTSLDGICMYAESLELLGMGISCSRR